MHVKIEYDSKSTSNKSFCQHAEYAKERDSQNASWLRKVSFGSAVARFGLLATHPRMMVGRTDADMTKGVGQISPTTYNIKRLWDDNVRGNFDSRHGWKRELHLESWAALPSALNKERYEVQREKQRLMGPGCYNIAIETRRPTSKRGAMDGSSQRFPKDPTLRFCGPGPGTYGKNGIPTTQLGQEKCFGTYSYLERRVCQRSVASTANNPPPGSYDHRDSIKELLNKVSKHVPCDLFVQQKETSNRMGHRPQGGFDASPKVAFSWMPKNSLELLNDAYNKQKGMWSKSKQYPVRSGERINCTVISVPAAGDISPGPGNYTGPAPFLGTIPEQQLEIFQKLRANKPEYGFNRSTKREFNFHRISSKAPGPGRYDIKRLFKVNKDNNTSSFKSPGGQLDPGKHNALKERLRSKNVPVNRRLDMGEWSMRPLLFQPQQHSWV